MVDTKNIRNLCILGGGGSGKTTLTESILYGLGVTTRMGKVEDGSTVSDYNEDEIKRRISINLSVACLENKDKRINIVDAPGYADFMGEVVASIKVCDTVALVISADTGFEAAGEDLWERVAEQKKPIIIFINKLDKPNIDLDAIIKQIEASTEVKLTPLNMPVYSGTNFDSYVDLLLMKKVKITDNKIVETGDLRELDNETKKYREKLIESVASCDDSLVEKYLEGQGITQNELINGLKNGLKERKIVPLIFGSAVNSIGSLFLLDFVSQFAVEPEVTGKETDSPIGLVFKTTSEPGMGQMNYIRMYSGKITAGMDLYNFTHETTERIGQICFLQGKKRIDANQGVAGDIIAVIKLKATRTNDILGEQKAGAEKVKEIQQIKFPIPLIDMAIQAKTKGEEDKLGNALQSVIIEDPTIKSNYNSETKQMVVSGLGSMQLEVMSQRMKARYNVDVELIPPRIPYKETVKGTAKVQGKFKRQSGGRGQYGDCWIQLEPMERGKGFEFIDKIFGGSVPKNYIPAIEKGVREAMADGVIAGYPITDLRVTLVDGSYHEVDSSDMAFKIAGSMALRKAVTEARPVVLEPVVEIEVVMPEEYMGAIMGDLNGRRGRVLGMDRVGKKQVVKANAPLGEVSRYVADLRSMTKGAGKFSLKFSHYEELPTHLAQKLMDEFQKTRKQEE